MTNAALAGHVVELADLMALEGSDPHRVTHYRRAATAIRRFEHSMAELVEAGTDLTVVPGIGKGLGRLLDDLVRRGSSPILDNRRTRVPEGLLSIMRLDGVGATRARTLGEAGVDSLDKLDELIAGREILRLDGFGPGVVSRLRSGLSARAALAGRSLLAKADDVARAIATWLGEAGVEVRPAGDVVRRTAIVSTVDLVCAADPDVLRGSLARMPDVRLDGRRGDNPTLASLDGVKIRLVATPPEMAEGVAHHLTGPPPYLEALTARARERRLDLTPTGMVHNAMPVAGGESGIYEGLQLPWIPPELREDAITIERAEAGLPRLVTCDDIRGDLHMHTTWSDGAATLRRMVRAAAARGYEYVAVTDHSPSTGVVAGLDARALRAQAAEIAEVQSEVPEVRILRGCEVDILPDGSLDLDDGALSELDLVLVSVHSSFEMDRVRMTDRIIRAMENPLVHVLGHPTGRKLGRRGPYAVDLVEVLRAAAALGVAVEVNGHPRRLDLDHEGLRLCGELGVRVVVSSDAHSVARLDNIRYGVDQARRGWLQADRIVNAGTFGQVLRWAGRRRG